MTDALLNAYQAVEALSRQMRQAAERADWPAFAEASQACTRQIETLRERRANPAGPDALCPVQAAQKHALLLTILRHDAQIRRLRTGLSPQLSQQLPQQASPPPAGAPTHGFSFGEYPLVANKGLLH